MLNVVLTAKDGSKIYPESIFSLTFSCDEDTPCDSLNLVVEGIISQEICGVTLYDGEKSVFEGIADEQITQFSHRDRTQIISRSTAAYCVDNEACPETFNFPDTQLIFDRYLRPLGFTSFRGENKVYGGKFRVSKGMSCFQVIENFSQGVYGSFPRINNREVVFEEEEKEPLMFSDDPYDKGVFYSFMEYSLRRYYPVSCVWVKTETNGGYDTPIRSEYAEGSGILRQRYLNASIPSEVSLAKADEILEKSHRKLESVTLRCPFAVFDALGRKAVISCEKQGLLTDYRVCSIRYTLKNTLEETKVILRRDS